MAGQLLIEADGLRAEQVTNLEPGAVGWLAEKFVSDGDQVTELIDVAQKSGDIEAVSWLMDFRHRRLSGAELVAEMTASGEASGEVECIDAAVSPRRRKRKFEL